MKRFYSPDSYCANGACVNDLLSQRLKTSQHIQSAISLSNFQPQQTKKIGRYYYNENDQIGRGYTSKVYKAYTTNSPSLITPQSEPYAIKVISLAKSSPSSVELLQNEIQILKMVDHPNIIKCYDIYKSKTHCYIITEYCPGGCLMNFLSKNQSTGAKKVLTEDKIISIVQQIVQGVKYLQLNGILHRDIKPANILKGKISWKIADFGFAVRSFTEVKSKFNVGTPLYMPIESLTQNLYSPQSDIFSVGVILYEMLTGTTPWESKSEKQLIRKMELIPLQRTSGKSFISPNIFKLIIKLCSLKKKFRMSKQEFADLQILQAIQQQSVQNPEASMADIKEKLTSVKSQILFERKLRQNKSLDHIQSYREKQNALNKNRKLFAGSMIFQKPQKSQLLTFEKIHSEILINQRPKQANEPKVLQSYGSKQEIIGSIKDRYFDIPLTIKSTNLKKNFATNPPRFIQKGSVRFQIKEAQKRQVNTRSTETKQQQIQMAQSISQITDPLVQTKYIDQLTHIFLNQIHYCRFLFYLYKNALYILLCKKSQEKLAVIIFQLIFQTMDQLNEIHNQNYEKKTGSIFTQKQKLQAYFKSEKCQTMKRTIIEYRQKYQKEYSALKIKLGQKAFEEVQFEKRQYQELLGRSSITRIGQNNKLLKYAQKQTKAFLKQYDHNLILTIDSMNTMSYLSSPRLHKPNGFISANMQGLKNLYQLYRLIGILVQSNKDIELFEKKSKIKVNTDFAKNNQVTSSELDRIRQLIRIL